jgi:hypothetical protein
MNSAEFHYFSQFPDDIVHNIFFCSGLELEDIVHATSVNKKWLQGRFEKMAMYSPEALSSVFSILLEDKPVPSLKEYAVATITWMMKSIRSIEPSEVDPFENLLQQLPQPTYTTPLSLRVVSSEYHTEELVAKLVSILKKFPCTESLDCDFGMESLDDFDAFIEFLPKTCVKLKKLSLPEVWALYFGGGRNFTHLKALTYLEEVHMTSHDLDDNLLQNLLDSCPKIHTLSLKTMNYSEPSHIEKTYINIKQFIVRCEANNFEHLLDIKIRLMRKIVLFPNLKKIDLIFKIKQKSIDFEERVSLESQEGAEGICQDLIKQLLLKPKAT